MEKIDTTLFKCPECGAVNSLDRWNDATYEDFGKHILELEDKINHEEDGFFICPACKKEAADSCIQRVAGKIFPVSVTVSYTAMIEAQNEDEAIAILDSMRTEEVLDQIGANPSIEFAAVDEY